METYPKLYNRDSLGNIRVWWLEREDNTYRTVAGLDLGEKVTSSWTECSGKNIGRSNETSPEQQAISECLAKIKKKKEQGDYFKNPADVDNETYFSPQLCKKYEDYESELAWVDGNYISPKLDGVRNVTNIKGSFSRNGKQFVSFPHILRELKPFFDKFPAEIFDGEAYADRLSNDFSKIISLAKKTKPTKEDLAESEQYLEYHIFDLPMYPGGYHERYTKLLEIFDEYFKNNRWIKLVNHRLIKSAAEIEPALQEYIEAGYEGLILNTYSGEYQNKRTHESLKFKRFLDEDFEVLDVIEGQGNRAKMAGYLKLKMSNGRIFDSNCRGNREYYRELLDNKSKVIGLKATVRFQNLTPEDGLNGGVPRFPCVIAIRDYE